MKPIDLVVVSTFLSVPEAQIARSILEANGIESMIRADNAGGMYPSLGGVELLVRSEDFAQANEALAQRDPPP